MDICYGFATWSGESSSYPSHAGHYGVTHSDATSSCLLGGRWEGYPKLCVLVRVFHGDHFERHPKPDV